MYNKNNLSRLPEVLLPWFYANKRDLPWRADREPYHIWLSEIMLQQTRVEAVKGYYSRFLESLPTVSDLADAPEDRLTKLWEGLGYYSRVRNLQKAARIIVREHGGVFPQSYEQVLALPGIGPYTAGAICSIAFDQKTPAVDGNVLRVMSRLTEDHRPIEQPAVKKHMEQLLRSIYPQQAGDFTQALMELGATVCGPDKAPRCEECPCRTLCRAWENGTAGQLPVRTLKKQRRQEELTVFVIRCGDRYALEKRPNSGLLAGLWQFPNIPGHIEAANGQSVLQTMGLRLTNVFRQTEKQHIFTHIQWNMRGFYVQVREPSGHFQWLTEAEIEQDAALPTAFRVFWKDRHMDAEQ